MFLILISKNKEPNFFTQRKAVDCTRCIYFYKPSIEVIFIFNANGLKPK